MPLFFIDKDAGCVLDQPPHAHGSSQVGDKESSEDEFEISAPDTKIDNKKNKSDIPKHKRYQLELASEIDTGLNMESYLTMGETIVGPRGSGKAPSVTQLHLDDAPNNELMSRSVLTPGVSKHQQVQTYEESLRKQRKQRKAEREKTKGKGWFGMRAPEMTEELKNERKGLVWNA